MGTILDQITLRIIKEQELVIGPLAWAEAKKVGGLSVQDGAGTVSIAGDGKAVVDQLISRYERLFGRASHEVCRDAVKTLIATMQPGDIPSSLR